MSENSQIGTKISSFIKGSSILVLSNVCLKAINFFLLPLYTSNLTPSMTGVSDSITTLTGVLFPLLTMGLDSAFSAFYFDSNDPERAKKVFSTICVVLSVIGCIPLILIPASPIISELLLHSADYGYIVAIALISVTFNLWYLSFALELRLQNKMFLYGLNGVIASLSMVALNIIFVSVIKLGEASLALSTMIVHIEQLAILILFAKAKPRLKWFDKELLKKMLKFAAPLVPMTVMTWVLSLSDRFVLLYYCGEAQVGLYGIGSRFSTLMNVVISAVSMAYTTFAFSSKEDKNSKRQYRNIYNIESAALIGIAFTASIFGKEIVGLMTTEAYGDSYLALRDLLFSQVFYAMTTVVGYGILFEKKSIYLLFGVSAGAILNLVLNFILIPKYGIAAAAFTTLVGNALYFAITLFYSEKLYPCDYGQKRVLLSLAVVYIACYFGTETSLGIKILIWVACFAGMLVAYKDILLKILTYAKRLVSRNQTNV